MMKVEIVKEYYIRRVDEKEKETPKKRNGEYLGTEEIYVGRSDGRRSRVDGVEARDERFDKRTDDKRAAYIGFEKRLIQSYVFPNFRYLILEQTAAYLLEAQ